MLPSPQRTLLLPLLVLSALLLLLLLLTPLHNPHTQDLSPVTTNNHPIINDNLTTYNEHINKIPIPFGSSSSSSSDHLNHFPSSSLLDTEDPELRKRALSWVQALAKGLESLGRLNGPRTDTSRWPDFAQLAENGWTVSKGIPERDVFTRPTTDYNGVGGPYAELGISQSKSFEITAAQYGSFRNCYRDDNPSSDAYYTNIYNVPNRAIIGTANFGAVYRLTNNRRGSDNTNLPPLSTRLPDLRLWSDIVWLVWAKQASEQKGLLKYIFKHDIETADTKRIVERAAGAGTDRFSSDWPGLKYLRGAVEFQALLGTAHGKGVAYLITDHPELRLKTVESVNIFTTNGGYAYHLLFTLTD